MLSKFQNYLTQNLKKKAKLNGFHREVAVANAKAASPSKTKTDPSETKTVKHVLNYIPLQAAFEADASQLSKRSWQRIKSHFIMMKSKT